MVKPAANNRSCYSEYLAVDRLSRPIATRNCSHLMPLFPFVFRDFTIALKDVPGPRAPVISLTRDNNVYQRRSIWLKSPVSYPDPLDTICDLSVDIIHSYVGDHEGMLCLHCAAVQVGQGLVLLPSTYRAGKSTLAVQLAALGTSIYTDDALCIQKNGEGRSLGISPRIRLPLPSSSSIELQQMVAANGKFRNTRYCYINMDKDQMPLHMNSAPISAIVLLKRVDGTSPSLRPVKKSKALTELILRNFARQNPAIDIIDRLSQIVQNKNVGTFELTFDNVHSAAETLLRELR